MSKPRGVAVSNVDDLLVAELPILKRAVMRIVERLKDPDLNLSGSVSIVIIARVMDPHRSETVHLRRKAWARVGRRS
ncbi:MAG TPA: hypothetical protein VJ553_02710 [Candidatus Paceibacterota bacterium]|nr:hypothetical protein [Candidatus Paceibacterota bacterium]